MVDRTFLWGGGTSTGSSPMRRATELGGRRHHDQQRLLVELELDDSLYQHSQRLGMENSALYPDERRSTYAGDARHSRHRSNGQHYAAEPKQSLPSRNHRDTAAKPRTERQMQQLHARRLSSPYKLKQEVLGTRHDPTSLRHHHHSPHSSSAGSLQRVTRSSSLQKTPAGLVIESVQQNIHLRDQVMAHVQQELMGVLPLHRASHVEKNVPQRVVKLLNRMRSLSLAVVEAVVYLSNELGANMTGTSVEHDILERDFYGYLLQMASSDTDFLACSPPLQRFFEDFEVNLTRNPFVDGLSLDSSEVLLCSCHQNATSDVLFGSASSSSSSLLRLLTHKLETFSLQAQRYLPGWQILPAERVAAALLHLMDLETRFNAVQMLPRYLQSHSGNRSRPIQQRDELEGGYGTFGGEIMQRLDRQDPRLSYSDHDLLRNDTSVMQAWAGSPTARSSMEVKSPSSRVLVATASSQPSLAQTSDDCARRLSSGFREARGLSPQDEARKPSLPSVAWVPPTSPTDLASVRANTSLEPSPSGSSLPSTLRKMPGADVGIEEPTQLELPVAMGDMSAATKSSSRSERSASEKKNRSAKAGHNQVIDVGVQMSVRNTSKDAVDVGIQMTQRNTATAGIMQTTHRSMASPSTDEGVQVRNEDSKEDMPCGIHASQPSTATTTATQTTHRSTRSISARSKHDEGIQMRDDTARSLSVSLSELELDAAGVSSRFSTLVPEIDVSEPLELVDHLSSIRSDDLLVVNGTEPAFFVPSMVKPLVLSRTVMEGEICAVGAPTTANQAIISVESGGEAEQGSDDMYECDFEYSSNEALSSIAMAMQMLPNFTLSTPESTLPDEVLKSEETTSPIKAASLLSTRTQEFLVDLTNNVQVSTPMQMLLEDGVSMELAESIEQKEETPPLEDEFAYSSSSAISNIAMALSLLPGVSRDDIFSVPEVESEHELEIPMDVSSSRISTYRSIISRLEEPLSAEAGEVFMEEALDYGAPVSSRRSVSVNMTDQQVFPVLPSLLGFNSSLTRLRSVDLSPVSGGSSVLVANSDQAILCETPVVISREMERSVPASSRSAISAATSYQGDNESEQSEFNKIFELCRDIQGTAFGMSHWVSQREVEDKIQSFAQPYSSLMGYASPVKTSHSPKYLERELKMLRRNFAWWKVWVVDHKRAKVVVRRLVARRKIRQFVNFHHWRRLQARIREENDRRFRAASRIQRNWRIYLQKREVSSRKDAFCVLHIAFYRTKFYMGISKRRCRREYAKEKVVRWWRQQRSRIKKKKQRLNQLSRERERRARARREIQKFLKEILLRRKLKAAQEMTKNILFKEQLKWTKAKRDVERSMELNSKHKKDLIADMDMRLADLDRKWKTAEDERLRLLSHHDRVVQQQQQAVEVRRRRLAALKLQMFFRVCRLHKKLHRAEAQKQQYQVRLQEELLTKQQRDFETQKRMSQSRTQARVLERKLDRLAQEAAKADTAHRETVQTHLARERTDQERYARQKIKAFIDARTLTRRADTERRRLVLEQARLQAEKTEIELMSSEEQREQRRVALSTALDLQQRLYDMETRSEDLRAAKDQLAADKEEERRQAAEALEHSRVEASMHQIASWVSGQVQLSRLKKEQAAITALAARELEEEKQKHRSANEAKIREIASIKASNLLHQRTSQHRNQKTVEAIRIQHQQKTAQEKTIAARTRTQLVQLVLDVKLLTELESTKGISQGLTGVAQFYKAQLHQFARLKLLRRLNCARKIQRAWRRWIHRKRVENAQQLALVKLEENKQRQASARRAQAWWRKWTQEQRSRREQKRIFDEHVGAIRRRANARKIQGVWRRWVQCQQERRHQQRLAFDKHLDTIRIRANVRKIQGIWRRWTKRESDRRRQQQLEFEAQLEQVRVRAHVRKIQGAWRRWVETERERRIQQQLVIDTRLKAIRARADVCRIQRSWRRWSLRERERRIKQQLSFTKHLEEIRLRANVRKIQRAWRRWTQGERVRRHVQRLAFDAQLKVIHMRAMVRKIQQVWRRWIKAERERRHQQQVAFNQQIQLIRDQANVRKIQGAWRRRTKRIQDRRRVHRLVFSHTLRIQRWWRKWRMKQRVNNTRNRIMQNACAQVIQRKWRSWHRWQRAKRERRRLRFQRDGCARRLQKNWRQWRNWKRRRNASAVRIQRRWAKLQKKKSREIRAVEQIQRLWRRWHRKSLERIEREREEERQVALKIQQNWTGKLFRRSKEQAERKQALDEQRSTQLENERQRLLKQEHERRNKAALVIQKQWRKMQQFEAEEHLLQQHACASKIQELWLTRPAAIRRLGNEENLQENTGDDFQREEKRSNQEEREEQQARETQNTSSLKIQRNWGIRQHRRKMERQRVQHEQHMAALKIQALWLKWHHEQQEELERERIRQEQDESSFKIERNWGVSQQRRRVSQERLRHKQNISALKIQKHWKRWRNLRLEQRTDSKIASPITTDAEQLERAKKLEVITRRSYGRCVTRTVKRYHQNQREQSAATKIEAIWKGKLYRMQYLEALEMKHDEEARQYRVLISVLATKVQICWRQWQVGIRQAKRAIVKSEELRLIQEARALEKKLLAAKRTLAAKRIQRALASRRSLIATKGVSHREVVPTASVASIKSIGEVDEEEHVEQPQIEESERNIQELKPEEVLMRATVEMTVEDWGHRQLPHILSRSVNQILFCHEAASAIQKCIRSYLRRRRMNFCFQRSFSTSESENVGTEHFNFYFKRARAWLDWESTSAPTTRLLRLRLDSQVTRKLLQVFGPSEEYTESESRQVLQEIAADVFPILHSPACVEDNENPMPELCYHDLEEMELPRSVKLLRQMEKHRAYLNRQVLLEVDIGAEKPTAALSVPLPSSPIGKSAPSSPSHRVKKEMTIFTAVETASVEDATFLQQRGFDLGALEAKTQRNALHMLSFSKENYRSRAEMLEFLLSCGANLNVNAVDCHGDTPSMLYASLGHLEFIKKLLQHGADLLLTNSRGQNVLHRACEADQVEICGFLQQLMMKDSIAEIIIPVETIASLVPASLSLHTPDRGDRFPLHYLADKGFIECAKQLVVSTESNFEWNRSLQAQGDAEGRTALHLAVLSHDVAMTAYLLTPGGGSDVNAFDDLHRSPLHYAVESPAALPIISRLVQHGANLNVADERGDTPLHWTAFSGRAAVMQSILALGADPTLRNSDWENPAQIAAAYGQLDCMRLLLQAQRRFGASQTEPREQQPALNRPASETTVLQRLAEAVDHLHQKQASAHSMRGDEDADLNLMEHETAAAEQAHGGYWEELHQDVQLVEESGQFSSEDEEDLLFGTDDDPSF